MKRLEARLAREGFRPRLLAYDSRQPLAEIAADLTARVFERFDPGPLNFVGHSLGGVLARLIAANLGAPGRLVQIASPNQGATITRFVPRFDWTRRVAGEVLFDLRPGSDALDLLAPPHPGLEVGVIAGSVRTGFSPVGLLAAAVEAIRPSARHDGTVAVASTRIEGMSDHLVLPHAHDVLPLSDDVIHQVLFFLRKGHFERGLAHHKRHVRKVTTAKRA
jgi:pimeloyl-ACP methyl ester carboxylesterase